VITRKISKLIRGKATPFQVYAACVLASLIAFVPGFSQAPGLLVLLIGLVVILNANLFLAGLVGLFVKLLALLLTPVSFVVGRFLLEGPTRGLFEGIVNAPILAYCGFDYFVVTGGQLLGLIFGVLLGFAATRSLGGMRRKLSAFEKDSAAFQKWSEKRWAKTAAFVFIGGIKGKQSYETLLAKRVGNPIRPVGAALVVLSIVFGFVAVRFLDDAIVASYARAGLERANGATVDLAGASLDLSDGRMVLTGLAMADPNDLGTNLFAADSITAQLSASDLLRKRAAIDEIIVVGATQGARRAVVGQLVGPRPVASEAAESAAEEAQSMDDLLSNAKVWKERLAVVRRWFDRLSSLRSDAEGGSAAAEQSYEDILRERLRALGYANVRDDSLVNQAPTLLIRRLEADGVNAASLPDELLSIVARNISTQPGLNAEPPRIEVASDSDKLRAELTLPGAGSSDGRLTFTLRNISVDEVASQLKSDGTPAISGGTMDISVDGVISATDSNLPMTVTLRDTNIRLVGSSPRSVSQLELPIEIRGPIDNPSIRFDKSSLGDAVLNAGKAELTNKVQSELSRRLGGSDTEEEGSGDVKESASGLLKGLLNR